LADINFFEDISKKKAFVLEAQRPTRKKTLIAPPDIFLTLRFPGEGIFFKIPSEYSLGISGGILDQASQSDESSDLLKVYN
jgi:hypothetical protein